MLDQTWGTFPLDGGIPESPFTKKFINHQHAFHVLTDQLDYGVAHMKHMAYIYTRIATLEEDYHTRVRNVVEEAKKFQLNGADSEMFGRAWLKSLEQYRLCAVQHMSFGKAVQNNLVDELNKHVTATEARLQKLKDKELAEMQELKELQRKYYESRSVCSRAIEIMKENTELVSAEVKDDSARSPRGRADRSPSPSPSPAHRRTKSAATIFNLKMSVQKLTKALKRTEDPEKVKRAAYDAATAFNESAVNHNNGQKRFHQQEMTRLVAEAERTEFERLLRMKACIIKFTALKHKSHETLALVIKKMEKVHDEMQISQQMEALLQENEETAVGPAFYPLDYDMPVSPEDIKSGRVVPAEHNANSFFGATLQRCMANQQAMMLFNTSGSMLPNDVPKLLSACIKGIKENNGYKTEGIFRISVSAEDLQQLQKAFDAGDFETKPLSPHVYAATLKHWLRHLQDPVISNLQYANAIAIAQDDANQTSTAYLNFLKSLDQLNVRVLKLIASMCTELASPENVLANRMDLHNIAIVFGPCLLRNPSEDPMEIMAGTRHEHTFTKAMFQAVGGRGRGSAVSPLSPPTAKRLGTSPDPSPPPSPKRGTTRGLSPAKRGSVKTPTGVSALPMSREERSSRVDEM